MDTAQPPEQAESPAYLLMARFKRDVAAKRFYTEIQEAIRTAACDLSVYVNTRLRVHHWFAAKWHRRFAAKPHHPPLAELPRRSWALPTRRLAPAPPLPGHAASADSCAP